MNKEYRDKEAERERKQDIQVNSFIAHALDKPPQEPEKDRIDHDMVQYIQTNDRFDRDDTADIELAADDNKPPSRSHFVD